MVGVNNVTVQFSGVPLFDNVSFIINPRDRIGLVGKNGAGKTTLLRVLFGLFEPETGNVSRPNGLTTGFLEQEMKLTGSGTVLEQALTAFKEAQELEKKIHSLTESISERTDFHSTEYMKLISGLNEANERFLIIGGHTRQADTEKVLTGLGFEPEELNRPLREFSGGWQMRVELAKILLQKPDLLLLDEPTNHLDIESIQWMEEFLEEYPGAVILVSHDRAFLDNVTKRTIEISLGKIFDYKLPYSDYAIKREEELEQQQAAFNNQQRQIAQIERFIERFRYKSTKARQVQSRMKLLDKMDKVEIEDLDRTAIHFHFPPAPPSGKIVAEALHLAKHYGPKLVFKGVDFHITQGEFIAFVGKNGMGKTTLSRIIVGELEYEGNIKLGHNVTIGYFAQNQAELLDGEKTVFQTIDDVAVGDIRPKIRNILGSFLFGGDTIDKKVKVLSGGEKSRLALARLLLTPANLLVLDEPTNHLDMPSKDILKNALLQFKGTVIIVSHDRDFLQSLTNKVFEFRNHTVKQYFGDIYDFLESRKLHSLAQLEKKNKKLTASEPDDSLSANKALYLKKKQQNKELKKLSNQIVKAEEEISKLEGEINKLDDILANPEKYKDAVADPALFQLYQSLQNKLQKQMEEWEFLHLQYEEAENSEEDTVDQ
ncbi:MAG: ABC-F family ATP-binding cassette domain-containing protein [Bacteroidetes bacterium]|nr:ABC-F family ATP-binding cassette domain-containing protein [Bacteroidota bacterium]